MIWWVDIQLDLVRLPWLGPPGVHPCLEAGTSFPDRPLAVPVCPSGAWPLWATGFWGWDPCNGRGLMDPGKVGITEVLLAPVTQPHLGLTGQMKLSRKVIQPALDQILKFASRSLL